MKHGKPSFNPPPCHACGEQVNAGNGPGGAFKKRFYCEECLRELKDGKVGPPPKSMFGGGSYGPHDDTSPGWDNMIRELES